MRASKMHLVGHVCAGPTNHHFGSWRHPESDAHLVCDVERYQTLAKIYERGLFDGVFLVDFQRLAMLNADGAGDFVKHGGGLHMMDPMQILVTMALATKHLGLAATMSTTLNNPYYIARAFATLDHLSKGRAGWNIVTSFSDEEARNYGWDRLPDKEVRYDRADETLEACLALWNGWEEGALKVDRKNGIFADPSKVHYVKYEGSMVRTEGALTAPRSPQGRPVFMQAGASERGLKFAGRWAEMVFTLQEEKSFMQAFYAELKGQVAQHGRNPDSCKILPSVEIVVARTMQEAEDQAEYIDSFAMPELAIKPLSVMLQRDLAKYPFDTPLAEIEKMEGGSRPMSGALKNVMDIRKDGRDLTIREACMRQVTAWFTPRMIGTPQMIADSLQDMFETECCDGFIITYPLSPGGLVDFVDLVVPELQRRGIYRREYSGRTFRENLMS